MRNALDSDVTDAQRNHEAILGSRRAETSANRRAFKLDLQGCRGPAKRVGDRARSRFWWSLAFWPCRVSFDEILTSVNSALNDRPTPLMIGGSYAGQGQEILSGECSAQTGVPHAGGCLIKRIRIL